MVETTIKPMKKAIPNSICCILVALLVLAFVTACDSSVNTQSDEPTFTLPASMAGTWNLYPGDTLPEGVYAPETAVIDDGPMMIEDKETGEMIPFEDAVWYPDYPNLKLTFSEVKDEYFYQLTMSLLDTEDNFLTETRITCEINPSNPDFLLISIVSYNDEAGWTEAVNIRYLREDAELLRSASQEV